MYSRSFVRYSLDTFTHVPPFGLLSRPSARLRNPCFAEGSLSLNESAIKRRWRRRARAALHQRVSQRRFPSFILPLLLNRCARHCARVLTCAAPPASPCRLVSFATAIYSLCLISPTAVQSGGSVCRTGNGEKLSNSQVCCLAQLCLAAA